MLPFIYNSEIVFMHNCFFFFFFSFMMFYDPPIVELRFGNRMLDTGQIGPGDDVYFECVARANPSTTIRYSWYHNVSNRFQRYLFELQGFASGLYALIVRHKLTHVCKITFNSIQINVFISYASPQNFLNVVHKLCCGRMKTGFHFDKTTFKTIWFANY